MVSKCIVSVELGGHVASTGEWRLRNPMCVCVCVCVTFHAQQRVEASNV